MKKNRVFSIGALLVLAVVLAACRVTVEPQISNREVVTSWVIPASGKHVVCENMDTDYEFRFDGPSSVASAEVTIQGVNIRAPQTVTVNRSRMESSAEHDYMFDVRLRSNTNPYPMSMDSDLETAAIVIRPTPPDAEPAEGGQQRVSAVIKDSSGRTLGVLNSTFDVWTGCR